jgi:S1-C subfamily serine protease
MEKVLDATAIIGTKKGSGSAFFINHDGCLFTAAHVVRDAIEKKYEVSIHLRGEPTSHKGMVVIASEYLDTAVVCSDTARRAPLRIISTEHLKQGQTVYAVGHPIPGANWHVTNGIISRMAYRMASTGKIWIPRYSMFTSAFISWGNSGGPLVDRYGNVVGMIVQWDGGPIGHPNNMNIAVTGSDLLRFRGSVWGK